MPPHYDCVVLGSGASGMAAALFFARSGASVALLEKAAVPGGAMQRFRRQGVPLDTGFHFTGGMTDCFGDILRLAGIRDELKPVPVRMKIFFTETGHKFTMPRGIEAAERYLIEQFPSEEKKIRDYFAMEREIFRTTPLFNLKSDWSMLDRAPGNADDITLKEYLDTLGIHGELRTILQSASTCYGTPSSEISLSSHCRIDYGLLNDLVRFQGGGDAVVKAFLREARTLGIQIRTGCTVKTFGPVSAGRIRNAVLTDGTEMEFDNLLFTVHPGEILRLLPREKIRPDFRARVEEFDETCGFFTVYAEVAPDAEPFVEELCSTLDSQDMDKAILANGSESAMGIMLTNEKDSSGAPRRTLTAFQSVSPAETKEWEGSRTGHRPESYAAYKKMKTERIVRRIFQAYPEFEGKIRILESASMLTYRDYLSPFGSAYGIRQKLGQDNVFGRLAVRNFYAAGQSAMLPGAFGAMLSSLVLFRKMEKEEKYTELLHKGGLLA